MAYGSGGSSAAELAVEGAYPIEFLCASRVVSKPAPPVRCVGRGTPVSCALSSGHFISSSVIRASVKNKKSKHAVVIVVRRRRRYATVIVIAYPLPGKLPHKEGDNTQYGNATRNGKPDDGRGPNTRAAAARIAATTAA
jgi:hypothetical protein